ncbi:hypothetical protein LSO07_24545 [Janthinobacterium sp. PLB04]|uniref:Uncharacterized protein n=1 Tax=Janthinobacterium lividum TaxID=29581 RepID=A0AAJ4T4Q4_9BURK|nr:MULTISPECIES: hypothetical protein [Janthinobacterium]KAB0326620.1 hypothetical protein F3B38_24215 [Janthinobacterium lividum]QSX95751.1 hypothetical protein J3P46_24405 [Janthinobacterium lividum]UGQ35604.1 hypothetical protein LSO07_24545 [Janthinobacterium sp. PLB04]
MLETVNDVCINAACGRTLPLRVAHCPFCGARQMAQAPVLEKTVAPPPVPRMPPPVPAAPPIPSPAPAPTPVPQPAPVPQAIPPAPAAPAAAPAKAPPAKPATRGSVPPPRPPVRLRTWIAAAVVLTGIWFFNKPADKPASVAEQVEAATALAAQCDLDGARSALAVLKSAKAPAAQIKRLQASITKSAATCDRQQQRAQAWLALQGSVNQALDAGKPELAATRLAVHVKRWGDDPDTLELDAKVKVALASAQLDLADACLARSDRVCLENSLIAAERYKRPELAARTQALRTALSQLLERSLLDASPGQ